MNIFDDLVDQALQSDGALGTVRPAVEKELLHHDILREMSRVGLLEGLTFIGGTCLRLCYGSPRLSEDLDFTGGADFSIDHLNMLKETLETTLMEKYSLPVVVSPPVCEEVNVCTWKLRMETQPLKKHLPAQRIHIDICAVPSHQRQPSLLRNHYGVDMGTDGLIVQIESAEEILADKWVALAMRRNRMQYRDLWDILFLQQRTVEFDGTLVLRKLNDRKISHGEFENALDKRLAELAMDIKHRGNYGAEMRRFLPPSAVQGLDHPDYWQMLMSSLQQTRKRLMDK